MQTIIWLIGITNYELTTQNLKFDTEIHLILWLVSAFCSWSLFLLAFGFLLANVLIWLFQALCCVVDTMESMVRALDRSKEHDDGRTVRQPYVDRRRKELKCKDELECRIWQPSDGRRSENLPSKWWTASKVGRARRRDEMCWRRHRGVDRRTILLSNSPRCLAAEFPVFANPWPKRLQQWLTIFSLLVLLASSCTLHSYPERRTTIRGFGDAHALYICLVFILDSGLRDDDINPQITISLPWVLGPRSVLGNFSRCTDLYG